MRGLAFFLAFIASLPLIFISPFNGILVWYVFSIGNFHTLIWGGPFSNLNYAYVIALVTCISWLFSRTEKKQLPLTPLVVLTLLFAIWITITSCFALAPSFDVWTKWTLVIKILFMCLVGFALTTTPDRVNQLIWTVALTVGVWGMKGAIWSLLRGGATIHGPDNGPLSDNNDFGLGLVLILPLLFYHWQLATHRLLRRGLLVVIFLVTLAVVLTYSRGALVGLSAMATVFWLRSRAKLVTGIFILLVAVSIYNFAPKDWFGRMETIQTYEEDQSAASRINLWKISLRIAELHPFTGGGFRVTYWPTITNKMLIGTDLPKLTQPRAPHSIYFDALSEHGWIGLALFLGIGAYSWLNCSWLIRNSRRRPDLGWANTLGRMGQPVLVGYATAGAFVSQAYLDEYWCIIFILEAARRIVTKEIATPARIFSIRSSSAPAVPPQAVTPTGFARSDHHGGLGTGGS
jgi:putative inorganic carbon (hco3(-)) transporter